MICIHVQYENMNPVRAGMGVCVFLGVRAFEYVSVNESRHVRVNCKCQKVIGICVPYVIMNKFAIVVIHYSP